MRNVTTPIKSTLPSRSKNSAFQPGSARAGQTTASPNGRSKVVVVSSAKTTNTLTKMTPQTKQNRMKKRSTAQNSPPKLAGAFQIAHDARPDPMAKAPARLTGTNDQQIIRGKRKQPPAAAPAETSAFGQPHQTQEDRGYIQLGSRPLTVAPPVNVPTTKQGALTERGPPRSSNAAQVRRGRPSNQNVAEPAVNPQAPQTGRDGKDRELFVSTVEIINPGVSPADQGKQSNLVVPKASNLPSPTISDKSSAKPRPSVDVNAREVPNYQENPFSIAHVGEQLQEDEQQSQGFDNDEPDLNLLVEQFFKEHPEQFQVFDYDENNQLKPIFMLGPCPSPPRDHSSHGRSSLNPFEGRESYSRAQPLAAKATTESNVNSFRIEGSFREASREPTVVVEEKVEAKDMNPVVPIQPEDTTEGEDVTIEAGDARGGWEDPLPVPAHEERETFEPKVPEPQPIQENKDLLDEESLNAELSATPQPASRPSKVVHQSTNKSYMQMVEPPQQIITEKQKPGKAPRNANLFGTGPSSYAIKENKYLDKIKRSPKPGNSSQERSPWRTNAKPQARQVKSPVRTPSRAPPRREPAFSSTMRPATSPVRKERRTVKPATTTSDFRAQVSIQSVEITPMKSSTTTKDIRNASRSTSRPPKSARSKPIDLGPTVAVGRIDMTSPTSRNRSKPKAPMADSFQSVRPISSRLSPTPRKLVSGKKKVEKKPSELVKIIATAVQSGVPSARKAQNKFQ